MSATRLLFAIAAACDFAPPPKPPPPDKPAEPKPAVVVQPDAAVVDDVTPDCLDTATHMIDVTNAAIPDDSERGAQERNRARLVRKTAEECSKKKWSRQVQDCYTAATTTEAMRGCDTLNK